MLWVASRNHRLDVFFHEGFAELWDSFTIFLLWAFTECLYKEKRSLISCMVALRQAHVRKDEFSSDLLPCFAEMDWFPYIFWRWPVSFFSFIFLRNHCKFEEFIFCVSIHCSFLFLFFPNTKVWVEGASSPWLLGSLDMIPVISERHPCLLMWQISLGSSCPIPAPDMEFTIISIGKPGFLP